MALINPMNVTSHHPKVGVSLHLAQGPFISGDEIRGKFTLESRSDKGLGLAAISVELTGFQGPGLPVSNAVLGELPADSPIMPRPYHPARKGQTSFFYQFPIPQYAPSSIDFGHGLAKVQYQVTANVEVFWKGEKRVVTIQRPVRILEGLPLLRNPIPNVILGEAGKIHVQGRMVGLFTMIGHPTCLELFVQNHSNKKTHGVTLRILRRIHLRHAPPQDHPFQLTDSLATIPFNGPEYSIGPGGEGVANLVFDVPTPAYGAGVGLRSEDRPKQGVPPLLFTVECELEITIGMPMGSQAISFSLPLITAHPETVPHLPPPQPPQPPPMVQQAPPPPVPQYNPYYAHDPYAPLEPPRLPFAQNPVSSTPPSPQFTPNLPPSPYTPNQPYPASPVQNPYFPQYASQPTTPLQQAYVSLPPTAPNYHGTSPSPISSPKPLPAVPVQPSSRPLPQPTPPSNTNGGHIAWQTPLVKPPSSVPSPPAPPQPVQVLANIPPPTTPKRGPLPTPPVTAQQPTSPPRPTDGAVEGKGVIASRVTQHLRQSSRTRSTSPTAHRFPLPPVSTAASQSKSKSKPLPTPLALAKTEASANPPAPPLESPKDPITHSGGSLAVPQSPSTGQVATGLSQPSGVLSPRPRLSPRMSYDEGIRNDGVKVASIKSKPVEELERMAEEVLKEEEKEAKHQSALGIELERESPVASGSNRREVYKAKPAGLPTASEIFGLDTQPVRQSRAMSTTSVPLKPPAVPHYESGLDALEKRLAGEKNAGMDAGDLWIYRRRAPSVAETASDSDASSVRSFRSQPGGPRAARKSNHSRERSQTSHKQARKESGLPPMPMPRAVTPTTPRNDHEKEVKRLQKEAVNRVGAWIGGVPSSESPALVPWATLSGQQMIPKTSSGFVSTKKPTFGPSAGRTPLTEVFAQPPPPVEAPSQQPPPNPRRGSANAFAENTPLQAAISTAQSPVIASKNVERQLLNIGPLKHAYDIRSARGGRGGVVTAVTAIWETKPGAGATDDPLDVPRETPPPRLQVKKKEPPVFKVPTVPASASLPVLSQPGLDTENAMSAERPGRVEDGQRIHHRALPDPAAINGTLAKPYLSSTASLAKVRLDPGPRPRPLAALGKPALLPVSQSAPQLRPSAIELTTTSPKPGAPPMGVGQAKLRELIAKYQNPTK
ncbi:hypothetical protein FRB90_004392 [Tulasnella sp. 427]|nr:hypothetical protein FRB90_004392 [Tulasnella sp. 427]